MRRVKYIVVDVGSESGESAWVVAAPVDPFTDADVVYRRISAKTSLADGLRLVAVMSGCSEGDGEP